MDTETVERGSEVWVVVSYEACPDVWLFSRYEDAVAWADAIGIGRVLVRNLDEEPAVDRVVVVS